MTYVYTSRHQKQNKKGRKVTLDDVYLNIYPFHYPLYLFASCKIIINLTKQRHFTTVHTQYIKRDMYACAGGRDPRTRGTEFRRCQGLNGASEQLKCYKTHTTIKPYV